MPKRKTEVIENFGERLAQLRRAAGFTQVEFATDIGITQRMAAYYEIPDAHPPPICCRRWRWESGSMCCRE